jgi:NADH-quinone oxidoreductase subunit A
MLWPLAAHFAAVIVLVAGILVLSHFLGQRHREAATGDPYESGIVSQGSARVRLSARFYLVAMFFVIFDVEAAYLFAWSVAVKETGWTGYAEALVFLAILGAALAYLWGTGSLDWGGKAPSPAPGREPG